MSFRNLPRFYVLLADFSIVLLSFILSYFIIKQFDFSDIWRKHLLVYTLTYCSCSLIIFYLMKIHTGVVRYTTIMDMVRIFGSIFLSSIIYWLADRFILSNLRINTLNANKVLLINLFVSSSALVMLRIAVRGVYYYLRPVSTSDEEKVIIYGSGPAVVIIKNALESAGPGGFSVVGFLNEHPGSGRLVIQSKRVYRMKDLPMLKNKMNVVKMIIPNTDLQANHKTAVINKCFELGIKIVTVPPADQWAYGKLKLKQMQDLKIEDLLQRDPINISDDKVAIQLSGKRILITGAAGSIGSEIVRQVLKYQPSLLILCDHAESDLYNIHIECQDKFPESDVVMHIGTVRSRQRMRVAFRKYRPEIVFHAAAYKHVPMMEDNPSEAVLTNVGGTKHLADLAIAHKVEKFLMISTDKAVNPTNIMGASKRIAEMYIQSLYDPSESSRTKFITTRFGNVLDSNGSVIPRFKAQIEKGGPVTVTHPEIVRYFMTIPEAVRLVLEAVCMGTGNEIFVFDMGKPVRINDLAMNMIRLTGLSADRDIKIIYTGLRPGEKLYEELLNDDESVLPTYHEKIKIAKIRSQDPEYMLESIGELLSLCNEEDSRLIVRKMKSIVPEFISQNSVFQDLDMGQMQENI